MALHPQHILNTRSFTSQPSTLTTDAQLLYRWAARFDLFMGDYIKRHPEVVRESGLPAEAIVRSLVKEQGGDMGSQMSTDKWQSTVEYLRGVIAAHGPFDGIGGFSEGAATAHNLLCMQAAGIDVGLSNVKFCLALSPWISPMMEMGSTLLKVPLLVTSGSRDIDMFQEAHPIYAADFSQVLTYIHDREHEYPFVSTELQAQFARLVEASTEATLASREASQELVARPTQDTASAPIGGMTMGPLLSEPFADLVPYGELNPSVVVNLADNLAWVDSIFYALDTNHDGRITLEELQQYIMPRNLACCAADIEMLFQSLDPCANGDIMHSGVCAGLRRFGVIGKSLLHWLVALQPALSADAETFGDFMRTGSPITINNGAHRAITLGQLKKLTALAQQRCRAEGWLGTHSPGDEQMMRYERLAPAGLTIHDMLPHVILPASHGQALPGGVGRPSLIEMVAEGPQETQYVVSHHPSECIENLISCIAQQTRDRMYGGSQLARVGSEAGKDGDEARVWVHSLAKRWWDDTADNAADDPTKPAFHQAMRLSMGTLSIVDSNGLYFRSPWCLYESVASQSICARDVGAPANGAYTHDVYTRVVSQPDHSLLPSQQAVGLVDGLAPADAALYGEAHTATVRSFRERLFPPWLLGMGVRATLQDCNVEGCPIDQQLILSCVLDDSRIDYQHGFEGVLSQQVEAANALLQERIAASSLRAAIQAGSEVLDTVLGVLAKSCRNVQRVFVELETCEQATPEVLARVGSALPADLQHLSLLSSKYLVSVPEISMLTQLRTLSLAGCKALTKLPDLTAMANLQTLELWGCEGLISLPDLSSLGQLQTLKLRGCKGLQALPTLSTAAMLQTLDLGFCSQFGALPGDILACVQLQTLDLDGWSELIALPDLSRLMCLQTLNLAFCTKLSTLPDLSTVMQLRRVDIEGCKLLVCTGQSEC